MTNWNFLQTFVVLAETLSFSETARILNTAQPVISRQIKILEENFGTALFIRSQSKKGVQMTREGLDLKMRLGPLVEEIKKLLAANTDPGAVISSSIRVGSVNEAGRILLFPKISNFIKKKPEIKIHLSLSSTALIIENVEKGIWDFGFIHRLDPRKSIQSFPVAQDIPVLIAKKGLAKNWRQQDLYRFVGYQENDLYLEKFVKSNLNRKEQKKVTIVSSVNSHDAILQAVRQQNCLAVIPLSSALESVEKGHVEILLKDKDKHELYFVCLENTLIDKNKKSFLNYILGEFGLETP